MSFADIAIASDLGTWHSGHHGDIWSLQGLDPLSLQAIRERTRALRWRG